MPDELARELELQQDAVHGPDRQAGLTGEVVGRDRGRAEKGDQSARRALRGLVGRLVEQKLSTALRGCGRLARQRQLLPELVDLVIGMEARLPRRLGRRLLRADARRER